MYDIGLNTNLVTGTVARTENLELISTRPRRMTVAGGKTLTTKHGVYRARLGPSVTGEDKTIDCQGVNSITGSLRKQVLHEVNAELRDSGLIDQQLPLPKHTAGGDVSKLVGIQDVQLDPVLAAVLPSGIAVY